MENKRLCGIAALVAGIPLMIGGVVGLLYSNSKLDEMDKEGYSREEKEDSREYQEMKNINEYGGASALAGIVLTGAGVPLALSRKKRHLCEINLNQSKSEPVKKESIRTNLDSQEQVIVYKQRLDREPTLEDRANMVGVEGFAKELQNHGWLDASGRALKKFRVMYEGHSEPKNNYIQCTAILTRDEDN